MRRLLIVDGMNVIRRTFEAVTNANDADRARKTEASSLATLTRLKHECGSDLQVCAFESVTPTWRHRLFPDYKAGRAPMPEALAQRLPALKKRMSELGFASVSAEGFEADDVIAAITRRAVLEDWSVAIASTDKDLTQLLVWPEVGIYHPFDRAWRDDRWLDSRFGISPGQVPDYLAMTGDAVDNVPGVPGIGPKAAAALLREFGSAHQALKRADTLSAQSGKWARAMRALRAHKENLALSLQLVGLADPALPGWELPR